MTNTTATTISILPKSPIIRSLTKETAKTDLEQALAAYNRSVAYRSNYYGDQIGICIGITHAETNEILNNYMTDLTNEQFLELIKQADTFDISCKTVSAYDNATHTLFKKNLWYLTYMPEGHSTLQPIELDTIVEYASNAHYDLKIELCFCEGERFRRYITFHQKVKNVSPFECIRIFFENDPDEEELQQVFPEDPAFLRETVSDDEEKGYGIVYYDDMGQPYTACYPTLERALERLIGFRVIKCECIIES